MDTNPAAEFEWFIDGVKQTDGVLPPTEAPPEGNVDLVDTISTLTFVPERADHDQRVSCKVSISTNGATEAEKGVTLKVFGNNYFANNFK